MKYGFIGCGNMGGAIARALSCATRDFMVTDRSGKAAILAEELGVSYGDTQSLVKNCDRLFLGVKPQMMQEVLAPLQGILREKKPLLITMAAGLTTATIEELAGCDLPVIRIMPNTPVAVGKGMTLYCRNRLVSDDILADFLSDLRFSGCLDALDEHLIDAACSLSGCGPAYVYYFMDALAKGAIACGVPADKALAYAAATVAGAAEMLTATGEEPQALIHAVCSPGGSTLAGMGVLKESDFSQTVEKCIAAAYKRNQELGKR